MMLMTTETPPPVVEDAPLLPAPMARRTRSSVAGVSSLRSGPQANPRRIRLTAPGNPVHR